MVSEEPWSPTSGHLPPHGEAGSFSRPEVVTGVGGIAPGPGGRCRVCPEPNQLQPGLINPMSTDWLTQAFPELIF